MLNLSEQTAIHTGNNHSATLKGSGRSGSRKKYLGGLAPHHLGGNNEQNYSVQLLLLSSIQQLMYNLCTVITLKIGGKLLGGLCPLAPT